MSAPYLKNPFLLKRGTTSKVAAYSGPEGELVIDITKGTIAVQTGTSGGVVLARLSDIPNKLSQLQNDTNYVTLEGVKQDYMPKADAVSTLDVNGTTITYTKADGTTGTIVTQDTTYSAGTGLNLANTTFSVTSTPGSSVLSWGTEVTLGTVGGLAIKAKLPANPNTDTLVTQSVVSGNATYPILLAATADAVANIGAAGVQFASGVKVNPLTSTITATTFNGTATRATADANGKSIADTYAAKTAIPTKLSQLANDTNFVAQGETATSATNDANGNAITGYIKNLSVSGKVITFTRGDTTTGTITTQDTNTDTLVAQNVSTANSTYPILLAATADATANIGAKAVQFASGVKVNPSTSTITATTFNGTATRATADANGKNIASTYATKAEVTSLRDGIIVNVTALPTTGESGKIYFLANNSGDTQNAYDEYAWVNNAWESLGPSTLDLAEYPKKSQTVSSFAVSGRTVTFTRADGTTGTFTTQDNNTWTAFKGATTDAAGTAGYVPAPAAGAANRYFRSDGTWQVPPNTTYSNMTAATASAAGKAGLVPAPAAGKQTSFLRGDGTWVVPTNTTYSAGTGLSLSGTTFSVASTAGTSTLAWNSEVTLYTVGGAAIKAKLPANPNTDTHWTTKLIAGVSDSTANAASTNGNTYLRLFDNSTARNSIKLVGAGKTTVTSDANGVITITSTDANTTYSAGTGLSLSGTTFSVSSTAGTSTLAWNSEVTLYTVGGAAIKAKLPANPNTDTKNTAGSTDTSSKIFLIGATSQAANPQTYSHDTAYVGTDGCLYSGGAKVLTAHQSLANYLTKTTNVSEMGRCIDMHYDNATMKYDYDVRIYVNSQGTAAGAGSLYITANGGIVSSGDISITKANPVLFVRNTNKTRGTAPSANVNVVEINGRDNANKNTWGIYQEYKTDKSIFTYLITYKGTTTDNSWTGIGAGYDASGNAYTYAPTPATGDKSTKIATTEFVKNQGYLTGITKAQVTGALGYTPPTTNTTYTFTDKNVTLAWGTKSTIATVGGTDIHVTMPANPNTTVATVVRPNNLANDAYVDVISVSASDKSTSGAANRVGTIRITNGNGANGILIGVHNEANGAPSGITLISTNGTISTSFAGTITAGLASGCTAVTQATSDNSTKIATTAFVKNQGYLTGITKAQVTGALGYTPPTTNTTYSAGTGLALSGTTFSVSSTAGTSALSWNTEVTLGTVGGLAIKAKLPANPNTNTDTLVTQNVSNTNAVYPILLCPTASATASQGAKTSIFSQCTCVNASNGSIEIKSALPYVTLRDTRYARSATAPTAASSCAFTIHDANNKSLAAFGYDIQANAKHSTAFMRAYLSTTTSDSDYTTVLLYRDNSSSSSVSAFVCGTTKGTTLGDGNHLWKQLYASTATINTSDEREKDFIDDIPDAVLDAWGDVSFKQFKMKDAIEEKGVDVARYHTGLIAQQIDAIFSKKDLDAAAYGLFCHDSWEAEDASYDENGNETAPPREAGDQYALRYEEALCVEAAYQRRRADRAERRLAFVEERLAAIESKLDI